MKLSIAAVIFAIAASASAAVIQPIEPIEVLAARQSECIDRPRATDRFFVSNPDRDDPRLTCQGFNENCRSYRNGQSVVITANCQISERNIVRATCIADFPRGQRSISYTRRVANNLGLGLSVDSDGRCNQQTGTTKCSKKDFNPNPRTICL